MGERINKENARERQQRGLVTRRSAEWRRKREEEKEKQRQIAEDVRVELDKPYKEGSDITLRQYIVKKVLRDLAKAEFSSTEDLLRLQKILGEHNIKIDIDQRPPSEAFVAMMEGEDADI